MAFTAIRIPPDTRVARSGPRRSPLERAICVGLAIGIAVQVLQRVFSVNFAMSEYARSLWYVTYEFGFARRGLAGEALRSLTGATPTLATVDLMGNVIAAVTLLGATLLVVMLCRHRTIVGYGTAAMLVVAPFGFDFVGGQRRPDLFGFLVLVGLGLWAATRRPRAILLALVGGLLLVVATLVSEVSALIVGPWLVLVAAAAARAEARSRRTVGLAMALAGLPSLGALVVLLQAGRMGPEQVALLESAAPPEIKGHGSVFSYLGDTFRGSLVRVVEGPTRLALSVVVGGLLVGLLAFASRRALAGVGTTFRWVLPGTMLRRTWVAGALAGAALLFALGLDWLRWVTAVGFAALLAIAAIVVLIDGAPSGPPDREAWQRPLPRQLALSRGGAVTLAIAVYLLLLPPLPNWVPNFESGGRLLLDIPR